MKIDQVLHRKGNQVATVMPAATVADLLTELARHGVGALVVSDDGRAILGLVSEREVVRALADRGTTVLGEPVTALMARTVLTVRPGDTTAHAMVVMTEERVRHLPVVDEAGLLVGIVSIGDVVKTRIDELEDERSALIGYVTS